MAKNKKSAPAKQEEVVETPAVEEVVETPAPEEVPAEQEEVVETPDTEVDEKVETPAKQEEEPTPEVDEKVETPDTEEVPAKQEEETPVVPTVAEKLHIDGIKAVLTDPKTTIETKLETILANGEATYANVVAGLKDYAEAVTNKVNKTNGNYVAGKNYDLLLNIKSILNTEDKDVFTLKFDILNLIFLNGKDAVFNVVKSYYSYYITLF